MGNCIGKKSGAKSKHWRHISSTISTTKLHSNNRLNIKRTLQQSSPPLLSSSPSSSKRISILLADLPDVKEYDPVFNHTDNNNEKIDQCPISLSTTINDQCLLIHTPTTSLPIQCENFQSNNTVIDRSENNITHSFSSTINEQDIAMGQFFSREIEPNDDQEVPNCAEELLSDSIVSSPSPSLTESSFSSLSCTTTPFSSQDQLILSSSSSSADHSPILSFYQFENRFRLSSLPYSEQIYFHPRSSHEIFSPILPLAYSRCHHDFFLNEFHQNILSHKCQTLSSLVDDVAQQQFIRIHRRTQPLLIEHKQFQCVQLKDMTKVETPSLIFDHDQKLVYITKYARWNGFQSITCVTKDVLQVFSSCDHCSSLLSGSKFNHYLWPFLYANTTYNLVQTCFNEINNNNNNLFGYISRTNPNYIQQTIINNSKLAYSYDLDVDYTTFYFVLRVQSWPQEIRAIFEQRQRLWPLNIDKLFDNTCFIRFSSAKDEISAIDQCHACEKMLSSSSDLTWSYTYAAMESQLVLGMSEGHIRFASIVWNYLHGRTQGQLPFRIYKHTLFYFFEQYASNSFLTNDLLNYIRLFTDFLSHRLQRKSLPHYFNPTLNLYNAEISLNITSIKITYFDLKHFSVYLLPKSSLYLYHLMYLIEYQSQFLHYFRSSKTNLLQTILETHELIIKQLSLGVQTYRRQLDSLESHRSLTLDCLYRYQEDNVCVVLDYLSLLREKEPSLLLHSLWSIFIQYFNSLFDDLFIS